MYLPCIGTCSNGDWGVTQYPHPVTEYFSFSSERCIFFSSNNSPYSCMSLYSGMGTRRGWGNEAAFDKGVAQCPVNTHLGLIKCLTENYRNHSRGTFQNNHAESFDKKQTWKCYCTYTSKINKHIFRFLLDWTIHRQAQKRGDGDGVRKEMNAKKK